MKKYFKLFCIRLIIYILVFLFLYNKGMYHCSACYIEDKVCIGGYGGFDVLSFFKGYFILCIISEIVYYLIYKFVNIKDKILIILSIAIFVLLNFGYYKLKENSYGYKDVYCMSCSIAYNCNENLTNCSFIYDTNEVRDGLNCSKYKN